MPTDDGGAGGANNTDNTSDDGGLVRSTRLMASGTLVSRITGMLRDVILVAAIGSALFADAYNVANVVPNVLYILLIGGVLNTVFLPQLVRAIKEETDGGEAYAQKLISAVLIVLAIMSVLAVILAPLIVAIYTAGWDEQQRSVAVTLARLCLPQIFFYGLYAMFSQVLNSRGRFGGPMWAPIANNLVVIGLGLFFILTVSGDLDVANVETWQLYVLGIGTTAGIVVQALVLVPPLRRSGFRLRLRFDLRGAGLRRAGSLGSWTLLFVLFTQLGYIVTTRLGTRAAAEAEQAGFTYGVGYTVYQKASLLFLLPHALITVSLVTALLPRMSGHAVEGRLDRIRDDVSYGSRMIGAILIPASLGLLLLGPSISGLLFGWGAAGLTGAHFIGLTLSGFALGLVPFSLFYLFSRVCYAQEDTRTPALVVGLVQVINVTTVLILSRTLSFKTLVVGMAISYSFAYVVGTLVLLVLVHRRLGHFHGYHVGRTFVRVLVASLVAAVPASLILLGIVATTDASVWSALASTLASGAAFLATFLWLARRMRVTEVQTMLGVVRGGRARPM